MNEFLIRAKGNCEKCGKEFSGNDCEQDVSVICQRCGKKMRLCKSCKNRGCICGGRFEDERERFAKKGYKIIF